jgi:hypothetical protein
MFGRLQRQVGQWWTDLRPDELPDSRYQVACAVVNLTGSRQSAPASRLYRFPSDGLSWGGKVRERFLAEESADKTLRGVEREELRRGILPLIVLMKGAGKPAIISRWVAQANLETDARRRADLGGMALALVALKDWSPAWKDALKRWNMIESPYVIEWQVATKREDVKKFLETRFGPLPADLVQRIDALTELKDVEPLIVEAARVKQLADFPL